MEVRGQFDEPSDSLTRPPHHERDNTHGNPNYLISGGDGGGEDSGGGLDGSGEGGVRVIMVVVVIFV